MKKYISILLILTFVFVISSCEMNEGGTDMDENNPYFIGKVVEKYESSCLLEVTDIGNGHFYEGGLVVVHTNVKSCPEYSIGDNLLISFDGRAAQSYPPQVFNVFSITKVE